jgi:hypothetical protein
LRDIKVPEDATNKQGHASNITRSHKFGLCGRK